MKAPQIEDGSAVKDPTSVVVLTEVKSHGLWLHKDETRVIDGRLAEYFAFHGWVKKTGEAAKPMAAGDASLDVQAGKHANAATKPA